MRLSKLLVPTLKEDPADAEVISHKLMVRAGMIRKLKLEQGYLLPRRRQAQKISNIHQVLVLHLQGVKTMHALSTKETIIKSSLFCIRKGRSMVVRNIRPCSFHR